MVEPAMPAAPAKILDKEVIPEADDSSSSSASSPTHDLINRESMYFIWGIYGEN